MTWTEQKSWLQARIGRRIQDARRNGRTEITSNQLARDLDRSAISIGMLLRQRDDVNMVLIAGRPRGKWRIRDPKVRVPGGEPADA